VVRQWKSHAIVVELIDNDRVFSCHRYADFVSELDQEVLSELILAANSMDIPDLLDLTCATIASMIKGKKFRSSSFLVVVRSTSSSSSIITILITLLFPTAFLFTLPRQNP
jgi:hypothetical protein